jgi:hypothetical protein
MKRKMLISFDVLLLIIVLLFLIIPDWESEPKVKDYFALLIWGEIGFDIYERLKNK